jgi:S-DNA-T family DNA segregation ATPase FtsK/SpoIIIE
LVAVSPRDRAILVLGGPGSGVSNVLDLLETQAEAQAAGGVVRVPRDPEGAWDAVAALHERLPAAGTVVLFDDLDGVALAFPPEYAQVVLERVERVVRRAGDAGILVVAGAHRLAGAVARVGELFPRRLLLPYPTRIDHAAAGGDATAFDPSAPPGRGRLDGRVLQVASAPKRSAASSSFAPVWLPTARLTGVVARRSPASRRALAAWDEAGARVLGVDEYAAAPSASVADPDRQVVVVGEPDDWQRHWRLLSDVRGDHDLVIDTSCAAELRVLAGFRGVPPYCEPGRPRGWLISAGDEPVRVVLPDAEEAMGSQPGDRSAGASSAA